MELKFTTIVVLGSRLTNAGEPTESLKSRVSKAVSVHSSTANSRILMSGGNPYGLSDFPTEAEVMRALAILEGASSFDIMLEDKSKTTIENALLVRNLLGVMESDNIILITSDYHMPRAKQIFIKTLNLKIDDTINSNLLKVFAKRNKLEYINSRDFSKIQLETVADIPVLLPSEKLALLKHEETLLPRVDLDYASVLSGVAEIISDPLSPKNC